MKLKYFKIAVIFAGALLVSCSGASKKSKGTAFAPQEKESTMSDEDPLLYALS